MTLDLWLELTGMTEADFAERIGSTQWNINRWRHGKRLPRPQVMRAIAKATKGCVQPSDFYRAMEGCDA